MSFLSPTPVASNLLRRTQRSPDYDTEQQSNTIANGSDADAGRQGHGREASGRSVLSNISTRLANMRERERETERVRQAGRANAMAERLLNDLNRWRLSSSAMHPSNAAAREDDVEAQLGQDNNDGNAAAQGANAQTNADGVAASSLRKITGKSRREREEGAALFGPNLANYFGSGSSSSGAVGGASTLSPTGGLSAAGNSAINTAASPSSPSAPTFADTNSPYGTARRSRLGSRGRARGASLSGLNLWSLNGDAVESVNSLGDLNAAPNSFGASAANLAENSSALGGAAIDSAGTLAMAEGIELDTLKRWIERSRVGGAMEIASADDAAQVRGDKGNPPTLCSTLQSYVNLKRNTIKLHHLTPSERGDVASDQQVRTPSTPFSPLSSSQAFPVPTATHSMYFEYDCAAPHAAVQVFVRASRKHGSWLAWQSTRESLGLPTDLTIGAEDDGESRYLGQRGPPPHVLGWPVHSARVQKGFGNPFTVHLALNIDLYAPPKAAPPQSASAATDHAEAGQSKPDSEDAQAANTDPSVQALPAPPAPVLIPETPGLNTSHRLDEPVTPAVASQNMSDPLAQPSADGAQSANAASTAAPVTSTEPESKEAKAARERAERETLKVAIVVEALDEDGKPLREPNLQTTYVRLASLPIRTASEEQVQLDVSGAAAELAHAGPVLDVALSPSANDAATKGSVAGAPTAITSSTVKRAWSVQVEGQEAEIGPHRFQLQELYGLSSRPPPPQQQREAQPDENADGENGLGDTGATALDDPMPDVAFGTGDDMGGGTASECLICLSSPPTTLLLPCTHGLCIDCAVQLRDTVKATRESERRRGRRPKRKYACPVCRRVYTSMLHLSAVDEKYVAQAGGA